VGVALVVVVLGIITFVMFDGRQAVRHKAGEEAANIALTLEHDLARTIGAVDLSLRAVVHGMSLPGLTALDPSARQSILFDGAIAAPDIEGVSVTDAAGNIIYSTIIPTPRQINVADRDYFRTLQANSDLGLFISRPLHSRLSGVWGLALARRISNPDGSFAGVTVSSVNLSYFSSLFNALELGEDGAVSLFSANGRLIVRRPDVGQAIVSEVGEADLFLHLADKPVGSFETGATAKGGGRLYAYRRITDLPLVVSVSVSNRQVFAGWTHRVGILIGALALLCSIGIVLASELRTEFARRGGAELAARISERRYAAALARLDALFENSADSMLIAQVDPDGNFAYEAVNPVWEAVYGIPASAAVGKSPDACLPPELCKTILAAWRECIRDRRQVHFRLRPKGVADQAELDILVAPVSDEFGNIQRLISVSRDMTEHNRLEEGMRQMHRLEAVGQLTAGIAHDFNNLLQAILGAMEALQEQPVLDGEARDCVSVAEGAARRGATLVHRLLAFSRLQPLSPVLVKPAEVLADIVELLTRTLGGRIHVQTEVAYGAWAVCVDSAQLDNCLLNLALNARDAMRDGGVLRLCARNAGPDAAQAAGLVAGEYTCFAVEDEGMGMSAETQARALVPFFTTKPIGEGSGLGLSMVHGFARQSGGDVRIESVSGRGTTVTLWLPRAEAPGGVATDPSEQARPDPGPELCAAVGQQAGRALDTRAISHQAPLQPGSTRERRSGPRVEFARWSQSAGAGDQGRGHARGAVTG
jgi:PAS domain S-box-containing protein